MAPKVSRLAFGALIALCGCLQGSPAASPALAVPDPTALDAVLEGEPAECQASIRARLLGRARGTESGGPEPAAAGCSGALARARKALAPAPDLRFGLVDRRVVELTGVSLELGVASRCPTWPQRPAGFFVLTSASARAAGCRTRPWSGALPVYAYTAGRDAAAPGGGVRIATVRVDEGVVRLDFDDLSRRAALSDQGSLWSFAWLELGDGGWAGAIDLVALRRILADYHIEWIRRGRGAPGLFMAAHPDAPQLDEASGLAFEADLARQARDYLAVSRGEMPPHEFLQRHLWSPYRGSVRKMAADAIRGGDLTEAGEPTRRRTD